MPTVRVAPAAREDLHHLVRALNLPPGTIDRVRSRLRDLREFPHLGPALAGRWAGFRVLLGPWPWLLIVYRYDESADQVLVVTFQDARSASAATGPG